MYKELFLRTRPLMKTRSYTWVLMVLIRCGCCLQGQSVTQILLPRTDAVTLEGANVRLPELFHNDASVLIIGFSRKSSDVTREWSKHLFEAEKSKGRSNVYGLIMLAKVPRFARGLVTSSIRGDVSPAAQSHFITITDNEAAWRKAVQAGSEEDVYILVVDGRGAVVWRGHGSYSDRVLEEIEDELQKVRVSEPLRLNGHVILPSPDTTVAIKADKAGSQ